MFCWRMALWLAGVALWNKLCRSRCSGLDFDYVYDFSPEDQAEAIDYKDPCKAGLQAGEELEDASRERKTPDFLIQISAAGYGSTCLLDKALT
ncbi:hypothetical protein E2320_008024 [Naja naja]|nr:hypothetical protein E2320_008024 [Naja naja]